jgi:hypothetical protein
MVEQVTFQTIFQFLQTVGILVGVYYYIMTIRTNQRNQLIQIETRQAQLYMQFLNPILTGEKSKVWAKLREWEFSDYDEAMEKYWSKSEHREIWSSLSGYFEGLGVYVREGLVPIRLVALTMTNMLTRFWDKFGPIILEYRVRENVPRNLSEIEYLYITLMKYLDEHPELKT